MFQAVPVSQEVSLVGVGSKKVSTVVRNVLCNCVYVCSGIEKNGSASLLVSSRSEVSVNNYCHGHSVQEQPEYWLCLVCCL